MVSYRTVIRTFGHKFEYPDAPDIEVDILRLVSAAHRTAVEEFLAVSDYPEYGAATIPAPVPFSQAEKFFPGVDAGIIDHLPVSERDGDQGRVLVIDTAVVHSDLAAEAVGIPHQLQGDLAVGLDSDTILICLSGHAKGLSSYGEILPGHSVGLFELGQVQFTQPCLEAETLGKDG